MGRASAEYLVHPHADTVILRDVTRPQRRNHYLGDVVRNTRRSHSFKSEAEVAE